MESAEATAKDIRDIYAKASRELNYQIAEIYERYQNKFNISEAEALMLLNQDITPDRIKELSEKLAELKGLEANEVLKELESPAYRKRIERLQQLQTNIDKMMRDVYEQEKLVSTDHYIEQYGNSYYHEVFDIMNATGLDYSFSYVDPKELNHIVGSNWSGANYSQRIWGNTQALAEELKTQLSLAYLTGKSEKDIAMELANKYSTGAANARRLVRTESAYISNQAVAAADKDAGIDKYRICAVLDLKTSEICREQDGQEYEYDDMEVGVNYPPFHPYCRTTVLSVLDDDCVEGFARRARDPVTGETKKIPASTTYKEWYAENVANNPEALFAEQVEKHRGADVKQYNKYINTIGKKELGSIDNFRDAKYKDPDKYSEIKLEYRKLNKYNNIMESEIVITDALKDTAEKAQAQMAGLEYRKKTKASFLRKIDKDTASSKNPKVVKEALDNIGDALRYTYVADADNLVEVFKTATEQLETRGYQFAKVKNTWRKNSAYRGVNCTVIAPDGYHTRFELQFHTPESLELKEGKLHKLYEEARDANTPIERQRELNRQMIELSNELEFPKNIDKIKMKG